MSAIQPITLDTATPAVQATLTKIKGAFGTVPNMFATVANSPAALQSMWGSFGAFSTGALGAALTEQIAVAVANRNRCEYCLAAHTAPRRPGGPYFRTALCSAARQRRRL